MPRISAAPNPVGLPSSPQRTTLLRVVALCALLAASVCAAGWRTDAGNGLPFAIGERLTYQVSVERAGKVGKAAMWVEGPIDVRGTRTYLLRFDSRVKVAFVTGVSRSSSWFDPRR
ncbi:MAG: hypothetical protein WD802_06710 [Gemmatimonadaceae bacterium]